MIKNTEGPEYVKKAEKCLKTSWLNWSADIDGAIENYIKAAECYKKSNNYDNAIMYYIKVSEMQEKQSSLFSSAQTLEKAANIYREQKMYTEMIDLIMKAGQKFRINGSSDSASQLMIRMARFLETDAPDVSAKLYFHASQVTQDKENLREAGELAGLAAKLFVRATDYESAQNALNIKLQNLSAAGDFHESGKAVVCLILLNLHNNDFVGASKVFSNGVESYNFASSQDCEPVNQLLSAVDQSDYEAARQILRGHTFIYLDNDFARLARDLKFSESRPMVVPGSVECDTLPSYDDDDDIN